MWVVVCDSEPEQGVCGSGESWVALSDATFAAISPELLGVDATAIAEVFAWGMGAVLLCWSLGYAVGVARAVINKA